MIVLEMRQAIADRVDWCRSQYRDSSRYAIEEEHVRYLGDLRATLKAAMGRTGAAARAG